MALKGRAKKEYQRRYMREYMEKKRLVVRKMLAERYGIKKVEDVTEQEEE